MGPSGWTNDDQRDFLSTFKPDYEACRIVKKYKDFWRKLFASWGARYPLIEEMFPGKALAELDETERKEYSARLDRLHAVCISRLSACIILWYLQIGQRLKEWFRWQYNPRSRNSTVAVTNKMLKQIYSTRKRGPKAYEAYAKLFPDKVAEAQRLRCEKEGIAGKMMLSKWHVVCQELLKNASEEEMEQVDEKVAQMTREDGDEDDDPDTFAPADFQRSNCPSPCFCVCGV